MLKGAGRRLRLLKRQFRLSHWLAKVCVRTSNPETDAIVTLTTCAEHTPYNSVIVLGLVAGTTPLKVVLVPILQDEHSCELIKNNKN